MKRELIVMRLANMERVHPDQITARCSGCNAEVGVFPSGQKIMRHFRDVALFCQVCRQPGSDARLAPGAELEPFQSHRKQ